MGAKKLIKDSIEIAFGSVAVNQAKEIDEPMGNVLGTTIVGGIVHKKSKELF